MMRWLEKRRRERRSDRYLFDFPDDASAVEAILFPVERFGTSIRSARQVADLTAGRELSEGEWINYGRRWERAWEHIVDR